MNTIKYFQGNKNKIKSDAPKKEHPNPIISANKSDSNLSMTFPPNEKPEGKVIRMSLAIDSEVMR